MSFIKSSLVKWDCTIASDQACVWSSVLARMLSLCISGGIPLSVGGRLDWCGLLRLRAGYLAHGDDIRKLRGLKRVGLQCSELDAAQDCRERDMTLLYNSTTSSFRAFA